MTNPTSLRYLSMSKHMRLGGDRPRRRTLTVRGSCHNEWGSLERSLDVGPPSTNENNKQQQQQQHFMIPTPLQKLATRNHVDHLMHCFVSLALTFHRHYIQSFIRGSLLALASMAKAFMARAGLLSSETDLFGEITCCTTPLGRLNLFLALFRGFVSLAEITHLLHMVATKARLIGQDEGSLSLGTTS